jgi:RHS repeat-associated protein
LGNKQYEITNHLGNVLAVITDRKLPYAPFGTANQGVIHSYYAQLISVTDYTAFGVALEGRTWSDEGYRYGFNGKEKDNEGMGGGGQTYDYGFRIYNPGLAKFLSVDPLHQSYPWLSPYQFAANRPIIAIDLDGLEAQPATGAQTITSDPNEMIFDGGMNNSVEITGELSGWQKFKAFGKGIIKGVVTVVVAAVVVTAVAAACVATFGAAAGPIVWGAATAYGVYTAVEQGAEIYYGKEDWGRGKDLTEGERWEKGGELVGGVAVGAKLKLGDKLFGGKGKSNSEFVEETPAEVATKVEIQQAYEPTGALKGKTFRHTWSKHGSHNTYELQMEAKNSGKAQGQWIDDIKSEQFIAEHLAELKNGAKVFDLPAGLGRIVNPDGTFSPATKAKLVPSGSGVKTAFPCNGDCN